MTDQVETRGWDTFKSADEANRQFVLPEEDSGYVLRIEKVPPPTLSPFVDLDEKGKEKPRKWQSLITFTIVDYANDDPDKSVIGQQVTQFYSISMHTKANFYKLVKAVFGGNVDPAWKPSASELQGRLISATIGHKDPNKDDKVYPKVTATLPYRGKNTYDDVVPVAREESEADQEPVPF